MKTHLLCLVALCLALPCLQSCSNSDLPEETTQSTVNDVRLRFSIASVGNPVSQSRDGDSPKFEYGRKIENDINNALIIIYDSPLNTGTGNVVATIYLSSLNTPTIYDGSSTKTMMAQYYATDGTANNVHANAYNIAHEYVQSSVDPGELPANTTLYAVALANTGNIASTFTGMTVASLREYVYRGELFTANYTGATNPTNKDCGNFVMSAVNEVKFSTVPDGEGVIDLQTFMVQRLAARVDIAFGLQNIEGTTINTKDDDGNYIYDIQYTTGGYYIFPIYDENIYQTESHREQRIADAYFHLYGIELKNVVTRNEYLFQHASGSPGYLGNEGTWNGGYPTKRVYTCSSRVVTASVPLTDYPDVSPYNIITGNIMPWASTGVFATYAILGYIGENTYNSYSDDNTYTTVKLTGKLVGMNSDHFTGTETGHDENVGVEYRLRHSYGEINTENPMCFGVVRNTVYRTYVKFFAGGEGVYARFYYYGNDGSNNFDEADGTNTQLNYTEVPFYSNILEYNNGTIND